MCNMYFSLYTFGKQKIQKVFFFYLMRYTHTVYREKLRALIYCPKNNYYWLVSFVVVSDTDGLLLAF